MNMESLSAKYPTKSGNAPSSGARVGVHRGKLKNISSEKLDSIFANVGQKLREGFSSEAEQILVDTIENYTLSPDNSANLKRLLSFTLETVGRYQESLDIVLPYEDEEMLETLSRETQVRVTTQLAISYNNLNDHPKAVTLLKETLTKAEQNSLHHLSGSIDSALARVYRKLNEFPIARDFAEKSLNYFRENGDWLGMAEAYREIALSYHQEGNGEKALDEFRARHQDHRRALGPVHAGQDLHRYVRRALVPPPAAGHHREPRKIDPILRSDRARPQFRDRL